MFKRKRHSYMDDLHLLIDRRVQTNALATQNHGYYDVIGDHPGGSHALEYNISERTRFTYATYCAGSLTCPVPFLTFLFVLNTLIAYSADVENV